MIQDQGPRTKGLRDKETKLELSVHIKNRSVILSEAYFSGVEGHAYRALHRLVLRFEETRVTKSLNSNALRARHQHHRRQPTQQDDQLHMLAAIVKLVEVNRQWIG